MINLTIAVVPLPSLASEQLVYAPDDDCCQSEFVNISIYISSKRQVFR